MIQEKGKRLSKKQAVVLLICAIVIAIITRLASSDFILVTILGAAAELTALFALISLFTKKGLRWK